MSERRSLIYWNWQRTAVLVIALLALLQFFRANRPSNPRNSSDAFKYTSGVIVDAPVVVPPRDFVSYKIDLNRRTKLRGEFRTGDREITIEILVLDAANFDAWKSGAPNSRISATSQVPGGKVIRVLEPGTYHIVLNNREGPNADVEKTVQATFAAE
jgi:hypothetical protein